ncbi:hypothetical protein X975_18737, partial [Stegodyphus mimosarum]
MYFCCVHNKIVCFICKEAISVLPKEYNLCHHYKMNYKEKFEILEGKLKEKSYTSLKSGLQGGGKLWKQIQ